MRIVNDLKFINGAGHTLPGRLAQGPPSGSETVAAEHAAEADPADAENHAAKSSGSCAHIAR